MDDSDRTSVSYMISFFFSLLYMVLPSAGHEELACGLFMYHYQYIENKVVYDTSKNIMYLLIFFFS